MASLGRDGIGVPRCVPAAIGQMNATKIKRGQRPGPPSFDDLFFNWPARIEITRSIPVEIRFQLPVYISHENDFPQIILVGAFKTGA